MLFNQCCNPVRRRQAGFFRIQGNRNLLCCIDLQNGPYPPATICLHWSNKNVTYFLFTGMSGTVIKELFPYFIEGMNDVMYPGRRFMGEVYLGTQNLMHGSDPLDSLDPIARRAYSAPIQAAEKAYSPFELTEVEEPPDKGFSTVQTNCRLESTWQSLLDFMGCSPAREPGWAETESKETGSGGKKKLDTSARPEIRKSFDRYLQAHQADYPRLREYEAVSEATGSYNCIAHSVRNDREVEMPKITIDEYDRFYAGHGFKPLDTLDFSNQEGMEKVVLYGLTPSDGDRYRMVKDAQGEEGARYSGPLCFHAVIQEKDGTYTSKMGAHEQIKIQSPDDLGGGIYGNPVRVYIRERK